MPVPSHSGSHSGGAGAISRFTGPRRLVVALLAALLALAGCSSSDGGGDNGGSSDDVTFEGDTLTLGLVAEPASLDMTTNDGAAIPQLLLDNVYETLIRVNDDGEIEGVLASDWTVSEDGLTYTFTIREGVTFSNGAPFTAEDAAFSINYVKSSWTTSVKNQFNVVTSATATSPTELTVVLEHPSNNWFYALTKRTGSMLSKDGGVADLANTPIGTGPYKFVSWSRGDSITLERNDDYWGDAPHFKTVVWKYYKDPTAMNNALLGGQIDVVTTVQAPEALDQFTDGPKANQFNVIEGTTNGEVVLSFHQTQGPLADVRVRQAIRHGIDHEKLLDNCWAGYGELIGSMVPPTDPWYEDRTGDYPFDADKAKSLLQEAGAADATLRLRVPTLPYAKSCGAEVKSQLEALGLTIQLDELEFPAAWLQTVFKDKDYDMSIVSHVEPRDMANVFGNPDYYTSYGTPQVQALFAEADAGDEATQTAKLKEAAKLISEDAAADFLFLLPNLVVAKKGIDGIQENAVGEATRVFNLTA